MTRKVLLLCGILASLLYIGTDIILGSSWHGYSFNSQAISELSAIGAPTRSLWVSMTFLFNPLVIAFGVGVLKIARSKRSLRATGILLILWGMSGFLWLFTPMHLRGEIGSTTDTLHLVMAAITVILLSAFIGVGSITQGKRFRFYSIITFIVMMAGGFLTAQQAPRVAAELPTPMMGIMERISVYSSMIWMLVLAVALLRQIGKSGNSASV